MHRIDGPGATVDNRFTEGNPATAVPATTVTDDWLNDMQEELITLLTAASITPVKGTQNQILAALRAAGVFQTAAQFDDTTKAATTAFVQRALGNKRGYLGVTASTSLTAAHCGMDIFASTSGAAITLSLPAASALAAGATFRVFNTGISDVIVSRVGGDTIVLGTTSNTVTAVTLKSGDWIELVSLGTGALWYHAGGTGQLGYSGAFGSSLAASGYQKLPSGLIIQWGTSASIAAGSSSTIAYPIAFPAGAVSGMAIPGVTASTTNPNPAGLQLFGAPASNAQFVIRNMGITSSYQYTWLVIGY